MAGTVISSAAVNDDLADIATALTGSLPRDGQAGMLGQFKAVDGSAGLPALAFSNETNTGFFRPGAGQIGVAIGGVQVATFTSSGFQGGLPIGIILDWPLNSVPTLFLLCYGQNVSRGTYALLFSIIGTTYGSGDGVTTFGVPDLRGRLLYGRDDMGGSASGRLNGTFFGPSTTIGGTGGVQSSQLITSNLPAYTPTGSIGVTDPGHSHLSQVAGTSGAQKPNGAGTTPFDLNTLSATTVNATGITASFSGNAQGGSSIPFTNVAPGMIVNKIIYAGA